MAESFSRDQEFEYKGLTFTLNSLMWSCDNKEVNYYEGYPHQEDDDYVQPHWVSAFLIRAYGVHDTNEEGTSLLFVCLRRMNSDVYAYGPETWDKYFVNVQDADEGYRVVNEYWANGVCADQSYIAVRDEYRQLVDIN